MSSTYSSELNCSEVVDSLGAYALDALDSDEREVIDAHLAVCPACSVALAEFTRTADALAFAVVPIQPSPELRARVMTSAGLSGVRESEPEPVSIAAAREAKAKRRAPAWLLPVVSAAAAVLLVAVGVLGVALAKMVDQRDDAATTAQMLSTYVSAGGNVVTLQAQPVSLYSSYDGKGSLLTAPGKDPVVVVAGCPKSGDYLTYWVWFSKDGKRVAAGKLTVGGDGSGWIALDDNLSLADFDTIGITIKVQDDKSEDVLVAPLSDSSVSQLQQS